MAKCIFCGTDIPEERMLCNECFEAEIQNSMDSDEAHEKGAA